ncbi:MAG: hypothetical protein JWL77_5244 [Chthonomonadaceae bacterium]|nr:hypothetical protein [Chthonomonadaceae bacterium]
MTTVDVEKIADAVLYDGYLLFPYRRSSMKNQQRWTFGGVYPHAYSEATGGDDPWLMQTQCLLEGGAETEIEVKIRYLHVVERKVRTDGPEMPHLVEELRVGREVYKPWEEAVEREQILRDSGTRRRIRLGDLLAAPRQFTIDVSAGSSEETLYDADEEEVGALVREWSSIQGKVELTAETLEMPERSISSQAPTNQLVRITVRIVNTTPLSPGQPPPSRIEAVRHALISTHTILQVVNGKFVSLLEPPEEFQRAAAECENIKTWPVLVGETGERQIMLSSPIILYDYPQVSPESQGNYFDATEIDELLALSVLTLTDDEKREMRESGEHGREILKRTEALSEEQLMKMHGVVRYLKPVRGESE